MRILYGLIVAVIILLIGACAWGAGNTKGKLARIVFVYESLAVVCGVIFSVYTFVPGINVTTLTKGLTMACYSWLVVILLYYTQYYTGVLKKAWWLKCVLFMYCILDTVMMTVNMWRHHIFSVREITSDTISIEFVQDSIFYKTHFIFTYGVVITLLLCYVIMMIKASKFYRFRYAVIFMSLLIAFMLDISTISSNSIYDLSMVIFGIMSILIYYFTLRYVPNELIENTFSLIIKDMNSGIVCFDNRGRCIYCNDLVRSIYNISDGLESLEKEYAKWNSDKTVVKQDSMRYELSVDREDDCRIYEIIYKRVYDDKGNFVCDYFMFNDRTEEVRALEYEKYRASHDSLTGLLNREQFYEDTNKVIHENKDMQFCLVCSNIKDFKLVNELFGIERGNEIITTQAELIRNTTEKNYISGRIQSDRFAVCMPKDRFRKEIMQNSITVMQNKFNNALFRLRVVVGVYDITDIDEPVSNMCDKAFIASETIRNNYETNIAYYDETLLQRTLEERRVIGEFEKALENGEFVMFLQPQVDVKGKAYGAEALVRWQHPERGLMSPFYFIDILESTGLIYKLDMYMWECAAAKLGEWKREGHTDQYISVNISTKDFYLIDVYDTITNLVQKYEINPENLKLEITETALMSDLKKNMTILEKLQKFGFKIEIDDFGSGYSSLNMLKDISADVLKIDMVFLRATENEAKGQDILESIISLGSKLGMEVVTEGVETEKQLLMLSEMGCNMFQGYYFSKPIPVAEYEQKYIWNR